MTASDDEWDSYKKGVKRLLKPDGEKQNAEQERRHCEEGKPTKQSRAAINDTGSPRRANARLAMTAAPNVLRPITLDRQRERDLKRGDITIEARLDLHGLTQERAYEALEIFLKQSRKAGFRFLLVITGKGRGEAGILRQKVPDWLEALPEARLILTVRPAALRHGGDGALYVILKNKKD